MGTSGWNYDHWKGPFYSRESSDGELLESYLQSFKTVEINNTFYQLPEKKTLKTWRETVPDDFKFAVKASRYITHMKKLKDPHESVPKFLDRVKILDEKLGPILFQLPPNWNFNSERLQAFLEFLPPDFNYAFELRDPSWLTEEAVNILGAHESAFCIYEYEGRVTDLQRTAGFVYIRLHGPEKTAYHGCYKDEALSEWAEEIANWVKEGIQVYCYFDNDQKGFAPSNALKLREIVERKIQ